MMLEIEVNRDEVHFGASVTVRFMRTLRVPDDGRAYQPLPTFGEFPVYSVQDYVDRVPAAWRTRPGLFIPTHPHEAMVISFSGRWWKPNAVTVGVGGINALTGKPWHEKLAGNPQDYLVCPDQHVLSGFKAADGRFRQFATPLMTKGPMAGAELAERKTCEGLQIMVFEPKTGLFPEHPPAKAARRVGESPRPSEAQGQTAVVGQVVLPDPHGVETWNPLSFGRVCVHIVSGAVFREITGQELPVSPVRASHYTKTGLPWPGVRGDDKEGQDSSDSGLADITGTAPLRSVAGWIA